MKTVLNKQQIRAICRAYENGEVKRSIYVRYCISQARLEKILKENGAVRKVPVKPKGRDSKNTQNKHEWLILLGVVPGEMAKRFFRGYQDANSIIIWLEKEKAYEFVMPDVTGKLYGVKK